MITWKAIVFFASLLVTFALIEDAIERIIVFSKKPYIEIISDRMIGKTPVLFSEWWAIISCILWATFYVIK